MKVRPRIWMILFLLGTLSCEQDPCEGVACVHGDCAEGVCSCDQGYEGADCGIQANQKFLGAWQVGDICQSGAYVYDCIVSEGTAPDAILFDNLRDDGLPVLGQVSQLDIVIPAQAFGQLIVSGSGAIDTVNDQINISYLLDYSGGQTETCLASFTKP